MTEKEVNTQQDYKRSNADMAAQWKIDVNRDPNDIPLQDMDPAHDDLFAANKVLPYFERLRREDPVHLSENGPYGRYWSITKYEDIMAVDTNHQVFSSDIRNGGIRLGGQRLEGDPDPLTHLPMFIMEDQPKHDEQRRAVQPMFTPQSLMNLEPLIRERAGLILDALPHGETFNWVREVSVELTGRTLATLFDVPQEDRHNLIHWSDTVERLGDPEYFETPEDGFKELWNCWEYFDGVWKERLSRKEPGSDLISMLAHSEATKNMSPNEYLGNMLLLIVGGNDTTRNSITGGVLALNQNPDQFRKLREDQSIIPNMVSEIIRWQSPVAHMCRTALEDTEIRGKKIRKWDKVAMWYVSGNRDEEKIARANEFLIDREGARQHLSFGFGIHRCIGNRVGEMQLRILWEEILKRFKSVEVAGDPKYLRSNFIRGITDLPVVVQPH